MFAQVIPLPIETPPPIASTSVAALPNAVRAMIEAAIARGDRKTIEAVLDLARQTNVGASTEIDQIATQWRLSIAEVEAAKKRANPTIQSPAAQPWKGQVELGASRGTGRNRYVGVLGSLALEREGTRWGQKLQTRIELQDGRNVADVERFAASWQPSYKVSNDLYSYGLAQVERDRAQGFDGRYTLGAGLGYTALRSSAAKLDFETGPAFRRVVPVGKYESAKSAAQSLAARASVSLRWAIAPTLELTQASAFYIEEGDRNASALTAVDAQLLGPLKVRLSYDVRYEARGRLGQSALDTLSRATIVYRF